MLHVLTPHPACAAFPELVGAELAELAIDIATHGLLCSITVHEGQVLDGRARLAACEAAGVEPRFETWTGTGDPTAWIVSRNLHRRHLTPSQRAMVAARLVTTSGRGRPGNSETFPNYTQADAAADLAVTARTIGRARRVLDSGTPELVASVDDGRLSVSTASAVAQLPQGDQVELFALDDADILERARAIQRTQRAQRHHRRTERELVRAEAAVLAAPEAEGIELELVDARDFLASLPRECAALIHADPSWPYRNQQNGQAAGHYPLMSLDDIVAMLDSAYDVALPDSYLVVWCTFPQVFPFARAVVAAERDGRWRWADLTGGAWGKRLEAHDRKGSGYHARGDAEPWMLLGKGKPAPLGRYHSNWHASPRTDHSEKPVEYLAELAEEYAPAGGLVVDLCAGLASMMRACWSSGHRYRGCEIDPVRHRLGLGRFASWQCEHPKWPEGVARGELTGGRLGGTAAPVPGAATVPSGPRRVQP